MQTQTSTSSSVKRRPAVKKTAKSNGITIPEPKQASKGSARTVYKYSGKKIECKTAQMIALIKTVQEAKKPVDPKKPDFDKNELDSSSFTSQDLVKLAVKQGNLITGQEPQRIFRFYTKRLKDEGYFSKV